MELFEQALAKLTKDLQSALNLLSHDEDTQDSPFAKVGDLIIFKGYRNNSEIWTFSSELRFADITAWGGTFTYQNDDVGISYSAERAVSDLFGQESIAVLKNGNPAFDIKNIIFILDSTKHISVSIEKGEFMASVSYRVDIDGKERTIFLVTTLKQTNS